MAVCRDCGAVDIEYEPCRCRQKDAVRDEFAKHALPMCLWLSSESHDRAQAAARYAYMVADAMMKARE